MRRHLVALALGAMSSLAHANVCGTDYQIFNPTTNGLDFVTVQSSETLKPCVLNTGVFLNYAVNSLTYSQTLNGSFPNGQKRKDRTLGLDLSAGIGLTDRWDFGVNIPFVLSQSVQDDYFVSSLGHNGATELKANTKYHLIGDDSWGVAAILSVNNNLVQDNPFVGHGAGLTWNYELAADTTIAEKWAVGVNFGYRDRNPGNQIAGVPFVPLDDQWIYSAAASYLVAQLDTKVILEVYGSKVVHHIDVDTDKSMNTLEGLLGFKYDMSENIALHFGGTHAIDKSQGGADWRVYAGMNWAIGPLCRKPAMGPIEVIDEPQTPAQRISTVKLDEDLLFGWDSDQLKPEELQALDDKFKEFFGSSFEKLSVEGHTDSIGHPAYNIDLSQRRAKFVRNYLVEKYHLDPARVESAGYGAEKPIADNGNFQGRRQNRRVELKIWRAL